MEGTQLDSLCTSCEDLFNNPGEEHAEQRLPVNKTFSNQRILTCARQREAIKYGCRGCAIFQNVHEPEDSDKFLDPNTRLVISSEWIRTPASNEKEAKYHLKRFNITDDKYMTAESTDTLQVREMHPIHSPSNEADYWKTLLASSRGSTTMFNHIRAWFDSCCSCESPYGSEAKEPFIPTRLLDVHACDTSGLVRVWKTCQEQVQYATLSYCWGGEQPWKLTSINQHQYEQGIRSDGLPRTFQDAVKVTISLGLRYLWVDAYCILQDSPEDKSYEISQMRYIFERSTVTIAAASGISASSGFLHHSNFRPRHRINLKSQGSLILEEMLTARATWANDWADAYHPAREPINTRAWTLEERLLSERVIVFPAKEWEAALWCPHGEQTSHGTECQPYELRSLSRGFQYFKINGSGESIENAMGAWSEIVFDFSQREMTEQKDKLRAIAGIASKFSELAGLKGAYCAGLWLVRIHEQLLWEVHKVGVRLTGNYAPSWSWASMNRPTITQAWIMEPHLAQIQVGKVDLLDTRNHFGAIKQAILYVRGHLKLVEEYRGPEDFPDTLWRYKIDGNQIEAAFDDETELPSHTKPDIYQLPIAKEDDTVQGLLLRKTIDQETCSRFVRVGRFRCDKDIHFLNRLDSDFRLVDIELT